MTFVLQSRLVQILHRFFVLLSWFINVSREIFFLLSPGFSGSFFSGSHSLALNSSLKSHQMTTFFYSKWVMSQKWCLFSGKFIILEIALSSKEEFIRLFCFPNEFFPLLRRRVAKHFYMGKRKGCCTKELIVLKNETWVNYFSEFLSSQPFLQ